MSHVHDVLNTLNSRVHDVLNTLRVHDVLNTDSYRLDLLIENAVIVEIKAVQRLEPVHEAQLLSYLKIAGCKVGLLINFHTQVLKHGIRRIVNNFPDSPRPQRSRR